MKTALITGASRGIGAAIAQELGRDYHVIVGARSEAAAREVADQLPSAEVFVADMADRAAVAAAVEELHLDALDVLVHSVGIYVAGPIAEVSSADWSAILDINVVAVADLTRLLLPKLRAAKGLVVTINSGSGFHSSPGSAPYAASKFALRAFTDALREEERGVVRVSSVHPGRVDTDMQVALQTERHAGDSTWRYDGSHYMTAGAIADAVRLVVDAGGNSNIDEIQVRPRG